ncbi:hypothetical protein [Hymenobacter convexus]|uniref:hypothetical protein n=1 Tax=Hymenobacter sp. CA1UV-4 TaxID=3063782 RepID=UPI002712A6E4|nr:hypothetical protein [Hymenobacter sp. CA1UV-4]MDO7851373.1 hypothetical protein [Hymenobacter sp. CA1UV-4]
MVNIIIAVDEQDADLGSYFQMCAADISFELQSDAHSQTYTYNIIRTDGLTQENIIKAISLVQDKNYIFIAYAHGNENCLGVQGADIFVDLDAGVGHFCKSIFYTFSCKTGINLGPGLIDAGCHVFWGYIKNAEIVRPFESLFLECANHGFKRLLIGDTVQEAFDYMIKKYNEYISAIYTRNLMAGQALMNNRDALRFFGNKDLRLADILD